MSFVKGIQFLHPMVSRYSLVAEPQGIDIQVESWLPSRVRVFAAEGLDLGNLALLFAMLFS